MSGLVVCQAEELEALILKALERAGLAAPVSEPPAVLDALEACELLRISRAKLHRLRKEGLPDHRVGDSPRFLRSELLAYVEAQ